MIEKVIVIKDNGGRLANQLWLYVSSYAYALEKNCEYENRSFYEYASKFVLPDKSTDGISTLYCSLVEMFSNPTIKKIFRYSIRLVYSFYSSAIIYLKKNQVLIAIDDVTYLPPTKTITNDVQVIEQKYKEVYLVGWKFRNPVGLIKHRSAIIKSIYPKHNLISKIKKNIDTYRENYKTIVGVHIRKGDYLSGQWNKFFISEKRASEILKEFLIIFNLSANSVLFIICSDGKIDIRPFVNLNIILNKGTDVSDLFTLSRCDFVIGTDSTYGAFASYYGDIPYIVMTNNKINWNYYLNKSRYFKNKYSTFVNY